MSIEAMKQALDALESTGLKWIQIEKAITALSEAIERYENPKWYSFTKTDIANIISEEYEDIWDLVYTIEDALKEMNQ